MNTIDIIKEIDESIRCLSDSERVSVCIGISANDATLEYVCRYRGSDICIDLYVDDEGSITSFVKPWFGGKGVLVPEGQGVICQSLCSRCDITTLREVADCIMEVIDRL